MSNAEKTIIPPETVIRAIEARRALRFDYEGHERLVYPHRCGIAGNGNTILEAWQFAGESRSGELPGWRTFFGSGIHHPKIMDEGFTPRPDYNPDDGKLKHPFAQIEKG